MRLDRTRHLPPVDLMNFRNVVKLAVGKATYLEWWTEGIVVGNVTATIMSSLFKESGESTVVA